MSKNKAPAFQFYVKDYLTDEKVVVMSLEHRGAYNDLLCHQWLEGTIPSDMESLAAICRTDEETMARLWPKLSRCFVEIGEDRLYNERLEEQRKERHEFIERCRKGGKASGKSRRKNAESSEVDEPNAKGGSTTLEPPLEPDAKQTSTLQSATADCSTALPKTNTTRARTLNTGVDARAMNDWNRWNSLGLPLPASVPEEEHLAGLTRLYTGPKTWRPSQVEQVMGWLKADPDPNQDWVRDRGPGYLAHRPRGQPQVIEQMLTRMSKPKDSPQNSEHAEPWRPPE